MKVLRKIYSVLDKICEPFAGACLVILVILSFGNVILRYVFNAPLTWAEEIEQLLYTFMVFFGLSITHKENSAVGVDIIISRLEPRYRRIADIISVSVTLFVWIVLCYLGVRMAIITKNTVTPYFNIPYHYIYWFFPIAGFFCVIQLINRLAHIIEGKDYFEKADIAIVSEKEE